MQPQPPHSRRFRHVGALVVLALGVALSTGSARAQDDPELLYENGLELLRQGKYELAELRFTRAIRLDDAVIEYHLALCDARVTTGRYDEAQAAVATLERRFPDDAQTAFRRGRLEELHGRYEAAIAAYDRAVERIDDFHEARVRAGLIDYEVLGHRDSGFKRLEWVLDYQNAHVAQMNPKQLQEPDPKLARRWLATGRALLALSAEHGQYFASAHKAFVKALECSKGGALDFEAEVALGRLILQDTRDVTARGRAEAVLAINPKHPEALLLEADCWRPRWQADKAEAAETRALETNPRHVEGLLMRGRRLLDDGDFAQARAALDQGLTVNDRHPMLLATRAVAAWFAGDEEDYQRFRERARAVNARQAHVDRVLAQRLVEGHRFDEALEAARRALAQDERDWDALVVLGDANFRLGRLAEAEEAYRKAYEGAPYRNSLTTKNKRKLLAKMTGPDFVTVSTESFIYKLHRDDEKRFLPLIQEHAERALEELSAKYEFTPRLPLILEVFERHNDFEVRIIGLTGIPGVLGVCFGQVLGMDSPAARDPGDFVWAQVLRHEMDHVFQIQISKGRVPRWLAEGLSVLEEQRCQPEWDREMDLYLHHAWAADELMRIGAINQMFRTGRIMEAYYSAGQMCAFIADRHGGFPTLKRMLELFSRDRPVEAVVQEALRMPVADFDDAFKSWVGAKVGVWKIMRPLSKADFESADLAWLKDKTDAQAAGRLARAHYMRGNRADAELFAGRALERDRGNLDALEVMGHVQFESDAKAKAAEYYRRFLESGGEHFLVHLRLGILDMNEGRLDGAEHHLLAAKRCFPRMVKPGGPYHLLAKLYEQEDRQGDRVSILEELAAISEDDRDLRAVLVQHYEAAGDFEREFHHALRQQWIFPYDAGLQRRLGRLFRLKGQRREARRAIEIGIACHPDPALEWVLRADLAGLNLEEGRLDDARDQIERAEFLTGEERPARLRHLRAWYEAAGGAGAETPRPPDQDIAGPFSVRPRDPQALEPLTQE